MKQITLATKSEHNVALIAWGLCNSTKKPAWKRIVNAASNHIHKRNPLMTFLPLGEGRTQITP
jgi:hypothetical protein